MNERTREIVAAVGDLIRIHDTWANDPQSHRTIPPDTFDQQANYVIATVRRGDWPADCRDLCKSVDAFGDAWDRYAAGEWNPDGSPKPAVMRTLADVITHYAGATQERVKSVEPVSVLLDQMRDWPNRYMAVARAYGERIVDGRGHARWDGIFFDGREVPRTDLIDQQARHERGQDGGKQIIPDGWQHPAEVARVEEHNRRHQTALSALVRRAEEQTATEDPATIEELIAEGQFADVVAKAKGVTEDEVREIAEENGLTINERLYSWHSVDPPRNQYSPAPAPESSPETQHSDPAPELPPVAEEVDVRQAVIDVWEDEPEMGSGEIAQRVREAYGEDINARQVGAILREHKKLQEA